MNIKNLICVFSFIFFTIYYSNSFATISEENKISNKTYTKNYFFDVVIRCASEDEEYKDMTEGKLQPNGTTIDFCNAHGNDRKKSPLRIKDIHTVDVNDLFLNDVVTYKLSSYHKNIRVTDQALAAYNANLNTLLQNNRSLTLILEIMSPVYDETDDLVTKSPFVDESTKALLLKSADLPQNLKHLKLIINDRNVVSLADGFLSGSSLQSFKCRLDNVKYIGKNFLTKCSELESFDCRLDNVTDIGNRFLARCPELESFDCRLDNLEHIKHNFLSNCTKLESINCRLDNVTDIGSNFLAKCPELESFDCRLDNLEHIKHNFLSNCTKLESINCRFDKLKDVGQHFLVNCTKLESELILEKSMARSNGDECQIRG